MGRLTREEAAAGSKALTGEIRQLVIAGKALLDTSLTERAVALPGSHRFVASRFRERPAS